MTAAPRWDEAMCLAAGIAPLMPAVDRPLADCAGAVLAHDVHAPMPIPHFDSSAMDGFAVAGPPPWILEDGCPALAGSAGATLLPGRARRVFTGSPVPAGASGIIRREYSAVTHDGPPASGSGHARLDLAPGSPVSELEPGRHIRRAGRESAAGEVLVPGGTVLSPAHIAYAAVAGLDVLPVRRRPRVALIQTGDEVRATGLPAVGEVRDAFGPQLPAYLHLLGADVVSQVRIGDDPAETRRALESALGGPGAGADDDADAEEVAPAADLVLTTGATGRSAADHVRRVVEDMAQEVVFEELDMRPGHPTMCTRLPGAATWHVGLPGNPLAAMVAMRVVVEPFLRAALGLPPAPVARVQLAAGAPAATVERLTPARRITAGAGTVEARTDGAEQQWKLCDRTGSNMLRGLSQADGLVVLPPRAVEPGRQVDCLELPWTARS
ncbi:molybdopterin molybdotransferase MoeA [Brevibacterium pityocampae]|uniref:Molybdopterin molybdenumtransferase n=1 Tax=Brevibacterium pityocampae TaxID=506594 RepID=A0ABP8JAQ0_9MICO